MLMLELHDMSVNLVSLNYFSKLNKLNRFQIHK